jgi:hypothetical protein
MECDVDMSRSGSEIFSTTNGEQHCDGGQSTAEKKEETHLSSLNAGTLPNLSAIDRKTLKLLKKDERSCLAE